MPSDPLTPPPASIDFVASVTTAGRPFVALMLDGKLFGHIAPEDALSSGLRAIQASIDAERDAAVVAASHKLCDGQGEVERLGFVTELLSLVRGRGPDAGSDAAAALARRRHG